MLDKKYLKLINEEIDGVITPEKKDELHEYLKQNPEAQNIYQELTQTSNLLNEIPPVEPSPNLKKRIINSVDFPRYAPDTKEPLFKSFILNWLYKPKVKLAYAFILGVFFSAIFITLLNINLSQKQKIDISELYGTIGITDLSDFKIINIIPVDLTEINGKIILRRFQQIVAIEINLNMVDESEIFLEFDSAYLRFDNFKPLIHSKIEIEYGANYIKISNIGSIQSTLFFTKTTSEITFLKLNLNHIGNTIYSKTILLELIY